MGATVDSRQVQAGDLFFALLGNKTDGHFYLEEVRARGARGAVIREDFSGVVPEGLSVGRVPCVLTELQRQARDWLREVGCVTIGITGSSGKTTTKEWLFALLEAAGEKVAHTVASQNSQIGMALSILNEVKLGCRWLVAEMGMSAPGEIARLVEIAPPAYVAITTLSPAHTAFFVDGVEGIARAKGEILLSKPRAFFSDAVAQYAPFSGYTNRGALQRASSPYVEFEHLSLSLQLAISILRELQIAVPDPLPQLPLPPHRCQLRREGPIWVLDDAYNANPSSMHAALDALEKICSLHQRRPVALLGSMKELGEKSFAAHQEILARARKLSAVFLVGPEWEPHLQPGDRWSSTQAQLPDCREGDCLLLKGSNSHQLWRFVKEIFPC